MAFVLKDRVLQTCSAPSGSAAFDFSATNAETGYQQWVDALADGDTTFYFASDASGNWETGVGTWTETGETLARTTVLESSNAGSAVTFSGTVTVGCGLPASRFNAKGTLFDMGEQVKAHGAVTESTDPGIDLDVDEGHVHTATIDADCKFNPVNTTAHGGTALTLILTKGANSVTWGSVTWAGGSAPDVSAADTYLIFFHFLGSTVYGVYGGAL